jgi:hypothetical protein
MRHIAALGLALLLATQASAMGQYLPPAAVPEPVAFALFAAGSALVGWALYRHRRK